MATQTLNPNAGTTYSNPVLDRALQTVGGDYEMFGRNIANWALSEARKAERQGTAAANGNAANAAVNFHFTLSGHVTADPGDTMVQLAIDTSNGKICLNILPEVSGI